MKFRRTRYQFGSLERKNRVRGPDVWVYRYRQIQPDRTTRHRSIVVGTVEQYPTRSQAWKAVEALRFAVNPDNPVQHGFTWGALIDHYLATELPVRKSTSRKYRSTLENHVKPKWGSYPFADVKRFAVQQWLDKVKTLDGTRPVSWKTKKHLRSMMHILYDCAMRWEFAPIGANPFGNRLVSIGRKTTKKRRSLTVEQFRVLLKHRLIAPDPFRTMVIVAVCLGLRCSELFGLRWSDINWDSLTLEVKRGVVQGEIDLPKTVQSEDPIPLAAEVAEVLWHWKCESLFSAPDDFIFANLLRAGRKPYDSSQLQRSRLRKAGEELGFAFPLGWHNFRHTYRTLLDETGAPASVQQALMRHADIRTTFEYGEAVSDTVREANSKVVAKLLKLEEGKEEGERK